MSKHEKRLVQAGIRRKDAVVLFHGAQVGLVLILLVVSIATGYMYRNTLLVVAFSIFLGIFLPDFWLTKKVDARKERIQLAIPDALDLAVVCVEAGIGLDQALVRIASELQHSYPDLSTEFGQDDPHHDRIHFSRYFCRRGRSGRDQDYPRSAADFGRAVTSDIAWSRQAMYGRHSQET